VGSGVSLISALGLLPRYPQRIQDIAVSRALMQFEAGSSEFSL
jgi:hypothetical protein